MKLLLASAYGLCLCVFSVYRIRRLWRRNDRREAWLYGVVMSVSGVVGALLIGGAELPSLVVPYIFAFEAIGKAILTP